nr:GNAT family N-acetyltransferase [uncultured Olsenella sp.]
MSRFLPPRLLGEGDDLSAFECGEPVVDTWVRRRALRSVRAGTAAVHVVTTEAGIIAGLYSLSAHSVLRADVQGGWLRRNVPEQIPAVLLGMLGVDRRFQGFGLGGSLLADAIERALVVSRQVGARAVLVDPASEKAGMFYKHYGFKVVPGTGWMYLPLGRG